MVFSYTIVFQIGEHLNQSKLMVSGHFSSFPSFMSILLLVEKVVQLFCALSGLMCCCLLKQQIKPLLIQQILEGRMFLQKSSELKEKTKESNRACSVKRLKLQTEADDQKVDLF